MGGDGGWDGLMASVHEHRTGGRGLSPEEGAEVVEEKDEEDDHGEEANEGEDVAEDMKE